MLSTNPLYVRNSRHFLAAWPNRKWSPRDGNSAVFVIVVPDGVRHWFSPDRRVALGHTRLSIIDLATGDQPIANEDGSLQIVVNGEFYGYEQIQKELERSGHRLRTLSDSEIPLHLYEDTGADCLQRLRGEFAMVLWDDVNRTLFAARDRFGIKPLFYAEHEGKLYTRIGN